MSDNWIRIECTNIESHKISSRSRMKKLPWAWANSENMKRIMFIWAIRVRLSVGCLLLWFSTSSWLCWSFLAIVVNEFRISDLSIVQPRLLTYILPNVATKLWFFSDYFIHYFGRLSYWLHFLNNTMDIKFAYFKSIWT
jgi:hypothetical protein